MQILKARVMSANQIKKQSKAYYRYGGHNDFTCCAGSPYFSNWSGHVPAYKFISIIRHSEFSIRSLTYSSQRPDSYKGIVSMGK